MTGSGTAKLKKAWAIKQDLSHYRLGEVLSGSRFSELITNNERLLGKYVRAKHGPNSPYILVNCTPNFPSD